MDDRALTRYRDRALAVLGSAPPTSLAETRTLLVDPLLSALGWDVTAASCERNETIADATLEYVCFVDSADDGGADTVPPTPALFVAVEPADGTLRTGRVDRLDAAMAETGVDRALYTNGRRIALFAGPESTDRVAFDVEVIRDHAADLAHFSAATAAGRLERHARDVAARRIAVRREALADTIADDVAAVAGTPHHSECRSIADAIVAEMHRSLADAGSTTGRHSDERRDAGGTIGTSDGTTPAELSDPEPLSAERDDVSGGDTDSGPGSVGDEESPGSIETGVEGGTSVDDEVGANELSRVGDGIGAELGAHGGDETKDRDEEEAEIGIEGGATDSDSTEPDASGGDENGEYVVRFFADRGSVGAVGHSTPAGSLVHAAEFLFERGLSGVRLPWSPENDDEPDAEPVLTAEPVGADGTPISSVTQLSNGVYLNTGGDDETKATRIRSLAERAGLRTMLGGDWPTSDS